MQKLLQFVMIPLAVLFLIPNFVDYNINEDRQKVAVNNKFDPLLCRLNTLAKLELYTDSLASTKNIQPGTLNYAILANDVVSERFYHKYASQNLNENWIASVLQKITGLYLSSKITADDILTRPYGYCGQVNMVLMELLERKKLNCRVIYLPKHFVIQSYINGRWNYFDPDMKPDILPQERSDEGFLKNTDSLSRAYKSNTALINSAFGNPVTYKFGKINEVQGPNAQIFQLITKILSRTAFLLPLLCYVYLIRKRKTTIATKYTQQTTQRWHYHFYNNERVGSTA